MKRRFIGLALTVTMLAGLLLGCSKPTEGRQTDKSDTTRTVTGAADTFTYAISADPGNTLNPITVDDRFGLMAAKLIYAPLYNLNEDGSADYVLAESMTPSDDGLTYTAVLKDGLKWTDGKPLTAQDVVFTYDSINKQGENLYIDGQPIKVAATDDKTVTFTLPEVSASAFELIASGVNILPKHIFEGRESFDLNLLEDDVVGCGAYKFVEYKTGQHFKFEKNPDYVNGEANIGTVIFKVIESDDTATLAMQNGEVDAWIGMPDLLKPFEDNQNFTVTNYSEGRIAYLRLNPKAASMKDQDYREGILQALDREEIMKAAYSDEDFFKLSYSFLPETNAYYSDDVEKWDQDIDQAKKLTKDGAESLKLCYIKTDTAQEAQALTIQAQLKEVGISVELAGMEQPAYVNAAYDRENTEYDMFLGGYIMGVDPDTFGGLFVTTKTDMLNYDNAEIDKLFADGNKVLDQADRKPIYDKLQKMTSEEALFYPFGSNLRTLVTNSRITGIEDAGLVPIFTFGDMSKLNIKE